LVELIEEPLVNWRYSVCESPVLKTIVSWSSGKDSAWMMQVLRARADVEVGGLVTTINEAAQRVAMHAVRVALLDAQAAALALPVWTVPLPSPCSNEAYEQAMRGVVERAVAEGFTHMASRICFWKTFAAIAKSGSPAPA
jgi:diphthamide synthase (EF-2-diphthine--ammonia ligase)